MPNKNVFSKNGLVLWLDAATADTIITDANGAVREWRDRSGAGNHAMSAAGKGRPVLVRDAMNGKSVVRFDGRSRLEIPVIRDVPGSVSVFVVSRRLPDQASDVRWQRLLSSWDGGSAEDNETPNFCVCLTSPKGTGESYPPTVVDVYRQACKIGPITIGCNRKHGGQGLRAEIAEILVFDRGFLAEGPILAVCRYLAEKWGAKIARADKGWTRLGGLGKTPVRSNELYPLSDQDNTGNWLRYEPMWDEFDGDRLDPQKWWPRNPSWKGRKPALFMEHNVRVRDGKLHLTMRAEDVPHAPAGYHSFTSAAVQSRTRVKYGYFEIKARPMRSRGSSAFWFYYNEPREWTEIDVFEIGGGAPGFERKYNMNLHVFHTPTEKKHWSRGGVWTAPWGLADDFHVYGLEWDVKNIKFYVDGVPVRRVTNTHWHQALTLNFDSETMPTWFGLPDPKNLPSTFSIEYVRVWRRPSRRRESPPPGS
ncbi:MAG: family 16 glycosylhydrolase [Kiritimatiellaeota bacterium]|nr:family 16 glycosylhydrolase [Kiritimatiellota bacterium]